MAVVEKQFIWRVIDEATSTIKKVVNAQKDGVAAAKKAVAEVKQVSEGWRDYGTNAKEASDRRSKRPKHKSAKSRNIARVLKLQSTASGPAWICTRISSKPCQIERSSI